MRLGEEEREGEAGMDKTHKSNLLNEKDVMIMRQKSRACYPLWDGVTEGVGTTTPLLSGGRIMQGQGWRRGGGRLVSAHHTEVVHQAGEGGPPPPPAPQGHYLMKLIVACHYLPGTAAAICHIEADNRPFPLPGGHIALSRPDSFI